MHEILKKKFINYYKDHHIRRYFLINNPDFKITIYISDNTRRVWVQGDKEFHGEYVMSKEEFIKRFSI